MSTTPQFSPSYVERLKKLTAPVESKELDEMFGPETDDEPDAVPPVPQETPAVPEKAATPLDGALAQAQRGIPQIPLRPREKAAFLSGWQNLATTDLEQIQVWAAQFPDCNWGSVAKPNSIWIFEVDSKNVLERIKDETKQKMPKTFRVRSSEGRGHFYFKPNAESSAMGNISQADVVGKDWSARVSSEYVVSPLSWHPKSGKQYEIISDSEIVEAPSWLIQWCIGQRIQKNEKTNRADKPTESRII